MSFKITFIGAGSVGFTRTLIRDLWKVPEFAQDNIEFALHDIDKDNLSRIRQILEKDRKANKLACKITASVERKKTLDGARYVINCTRIGGLEAFATDINIPLQYGVDQCVGDTLCAGGIMYGQRNIPQILAFQKDMSELCDNDHGQAIFLNYANPMAMNTWAAIDAHDRGEGIRTVGLCHGVEGGWKQIDAVMANLYGDESTPSHDPLALNARTQIVCAGINHQTWYTHVCYKGKMVDSPTLIKAFEAHPTYAKTEKVRIDVLKRFGYYSTESNGHLSEYVPWYRKRAKDIKKWIDMSSWINGETGGYLRVCTEGRNWFKTDFPKWLNEAGKSLEDYNRSSEHGSYIIESLETNRIYRGHFNVRNKGIITNLPNDCIVEAPGYVDATGINMQAGIELPLACAATCNASISVQRMSKQAAITGDVTLLKQAMLHDPLVAAILNPQEIWQMTDQMLIAQAKWLPNYKKSAIIAAKKRMAQGTIKTKDWTGAARVKVKSVAQLRKDKEASVWSADKAAAQRAEDAKSPTNA